MKYTLEIDIDLPRDRVITLFDNPENLKHWQPGFMSMEPLSGTPGQAGATSRLKYKIGGRELELIETITVRNLPDEFSGTYETEGMWNEVRNIFQAVDHNKTRWISYVEFRPSSFSLKLMMKLAPGAFRKQSYQFMKDFKKWAEGNADVS
ncbi:MAG TPA: SRPBCC family protein [Saprospiraceae bacterium]|nr:SRPBCC family protein [Saprospiraceae bacterium]